MFLGNDQTVWKIQKLKQGDKRGSWVYIRDRVFMPCRGKWWKLMCMLLSCRIEDALNVYFKGYIQAWDMKIWSFRKSHNSNGNYRGVLSLCGKKRTANEVQEQNYSWALGVTLPRLNSSMQHFNQLLCWGPLIKQSASKISSLLSGWKVSQFHYAREGRADLGAFFFLRDLSAWRMAWITFLVGLW